MIKIGKIHDSLTIIKVEGDEVYLPEKDGKKFKWYATIITPERLKKFRPIQDEELAHMIMQNDIEKRIS